MIPHIITGLWQLRVERHNSLHNMELWEYIHEIQPALDLLPPPQSCCRLSGHDAPEFTLLSKAYS